MGDTGGIIQGDNSARHCFVIRDMNMNMKLKMCTTGKILGQICLKVFRDTFVQYVVCNQERDGVRHKKHSEECIWSEHCNNFEKSERVYFLS